jgi:hypothetical protein
MNVPSIPKAPKTPGAIVDSLYALRTERLRIEREVDALKKRETALREKLLALLPRLDATRVSGLRATATISRVTVPHVTDWDALYAHIRSTGAFELLQRRVGVEAWRERNDAKQPVPGTEPFVDFKITCTKLGERA